MTAVDHVTPAERCPTRDEQTKAALALESPTLAKRIGDLLNCAEVQRMPGNARTSEYMRGMANGLEFSAAVMQAREPDYLTEAIGSKTLDKEQIRQAVNALSYDAFLNRADVEIADSIFAKAHELMGAAQPSDSKAQFGDVRAAGSVLQRICHNASAKAGWWIDAKTGKSFTENPMCFAQKLMLAVSELSEAMEGDRKALMDDHLPHRSMREVELADAVIRIFDLAGAYGMDIGSAIAEKLAYNAKRPDHKLEARAAAGGKAY